MAAVSQVVDFSATQGNGINLQLSDIGYSSQFQLGQFQAPETKLNIQLDQTQYHQGQVAANLAHDVGNYGQMTHKEHVYKISDTYIGSDQKIERAAMVLEFDEQNQPHIKSKLITLPEGIERLFLEILSNAGDNAIESRLDGVKPGQIEVTMDNNTISIRNGGKVVPVKMHSSGKYVGEFIFGTLLTSSNYTKKVRKGAGRNGYGAKLVNLYSKYFKLEIGDPTTGKSYVQEWRDNMNDRQDPVIAENHKGPGYLQITWNLDHQRFGYTKYPTEAYHLFMRHCADVAFTQRIPVIFNGYTFDATDIEKYSHYYFGLENHNLVHYQWAEGVETTIKRGGLVVATDKNVLPDLEVILVDTPGESQILAFTNGLINSEGGVHVNAVLKAVQNPILKKVNDIISSTSGRSKKAKNGKAAKELDLPKVTNNDLKKNISMIVVYRAEDPKYKGQYKESLTSPTPVVKIMEDRFKILEKWNLIRKLYLAFEAKLNKKLKMTDGKNSRRVKVLRHTPANNAGKSVRLSKECVLVITEGDSANTYAEKYYAELGPNYHDIYGFFPIKGKLLNPRGKALIKLLNNNEITGFKKVMGLRHDVDYSIQTNRDRLRYGRICIITDPDVDGKHITGLLVNYLNYAFPSLLENDMVEYVRVPVLKVSLRGQIGSFYSMAEYNQWKRQTSNYKSWNHRYFKGLGTSEDEEIKSDFANHYPVNVRPDNYSQRYIELAFEPKMAYRRKDLIDRYKENTDPTRYRQQSISNLISVDVAEFWKDDVERSIAAFADGLKTSQRKVLYAAIKKWGLTSTEAARRSKSLKVFVFGAKVTGDTMYHHGDASMNSTIIGMAQDFPGSNNMNHLYPKGQFGSRNKNGKDAAAPRYIETYLNWWVQYIYRKDDLMIMKQVEDEGQLCEYERFYPIIPMFMVNGVMGIGTGYSSFIPCFNPMDLCMWLLAKLNGQELPTLCPWYRGFTGDIKVEEIKTVEKAHDSNNANEQSIQPSSEKDSDQYSDILGETAESMGDDDVEFDLGTRRRKITNGKRVYICGIFEAPSVPEDKDMEIIVTELPVGRPSQAYKAWLEDQVEEGHIKSFAIKGTPNAPRFIIKGIKNASNKKLRLIRSFPLTNMVLLNDDSRPLFYNSIDDIMDTFYIYRLKKYEQRKAAQLLKIQDEINFLQYKLILILAVVEGRIQFRQRRKQEILQDMTNLQIPAQIKTHDGQVVDLQLKLLKSINLLNLTMDDVEKLQAEIAKTQAELEHIQLIPPATFWQDELVEFVRVYLKRNTQECKKCNKGRRSKKNNLSMQLEDESKRFNHISVLKTPLADLYNKPPPPPKQNRQQAPMIIINSTDPYYVPNIQPNIQPNVQLIIQPNVQPDIQPNVQPDIQLNVQPDIQPNVQPDIQLNVQPDIQPNVQPDIQPNVQPDIQLNVQPDIQPNVQPDIQPDIQLDIQSKVQTAQSTFSISLS